LGAFHVEEHVVAWSEFGFVQAGPESKAIGPDRVAAGADGLQALWDPVRQRVIVLQDLAVVGGFSAERIDDLAFAGRRLVLMSGRTLVLRDDKGAELGRIGVPDVVPTNIELLVRDGTVWGVDPFGNLHAIATVDSDLHPVTGASFGGRAFPAARVAKDPAALKTSVRSLGGDWVIVDAVVRDFPIGVERSIAHDSRTLSLETADRAWVPTDDADVDAEGRLVVMVPLEDGLHLRRVSP
jgi:hypothetical protein